MVADVVRFYKWIFLDFGLQNYSTGNKDALPFFLYIATRDPIYSTQFDPEKKTHNAFFYKNNVIKFNFTVYWCETGDKEKELFSRHQSST